jgi:hypothetical protein
VHGTDEFGISELLADSFVPCVVLEPELSVDMATGIPYW